MNNPFEKIKSPRRSPQEIEQTYKEIEQRLQSKKKRFIITNGALLASIAAILLFLLSTYEQPYSTNSAAGNSIKKMYVVEYDLSLYDVQGVEKWYYLNKQMVNESQIKPLLQLIERVDKSAPVKSDNYNVSLNDALIAVHEDSSISYYVTERDDDANYYIRNEVTHQQTMLTIEEYLLISSIKKAPAISTQLLFGLLLTLVYLLYIAMLPKISPAIRQNLFQKNTWMELVRAYILMRFTTIGLLLLIVWVSPAVNLFVLIGIVSIVFIARIGKEYYEGNFKRSIWEIPISIITYTTILYLILIP